MAINFTEKRTFMERINFSRESKTLMYLLLTVGILSLTYALFRIFRSIMNGAGLFSGHHHIIAFVGLLAQIIFGFVFILLWYTNSKYRKYYIEWDDEKMRFRLPSKPQTHTIDLKNIKSAAITSGNLELWFRDDSMESIDLKGIDFEDLQMIKNTFLTKEYNE